MPCRKVEMKKIENVQSRRVSFSKRRASFLKKAHQLSVICDAEVAIIIFSSSGKLFEYASSSMKETIKRYDKYQGSSDAHVIDSGTENQEDCTEVDRLKDEISKLQEKNLKLQGEGLSILSLKELQELEQQLNAALISVRDRKELVLANQLEESWLKAHEAELEKETVLRQVQELKSLFPSINQHYVPSSVKCFSIDPKNSFVNHTCLDDNKCSLRKTNTDTTLQLGLPGEVHDKRENEENIESPSNDSVTTNTTRATLHK